MLSNSDYQKIEDALSQGRKLTITFEFVENCLDWRSEDEENTELKSIQKSACRLVSCLTTLFWYR
jgi:hypothetical protein